MALILVVYQVLVWNHGPEKVAEWIENIVSEQPIRIQLDDIERLAVDE